MVNKEFYYLMLDQKLEMYDLNKYLYKKEVKKIIRKERKTHEDKIDPLMERLQILKKDIGKKLENENKKTKIFSIFDRIERLIKDEDE